MEENRPEIVRINEHTWSVEDSGVRVFVLEGSDAALVIDSGRSLTGLRQIAGGLTARPLQLLNTHSDMDHIACNDEFEWAYMHRDETAVYLEKGMKCAARPVEDGDIIDLGGRRLMVLHVPGHTPGSITVLDIDERSLYGGDPIQNGNIYMFGPHRNMELYVKGLRALRENHKEDFDRIYGSHGTVPVDASIIDGLIEGAEGILAGELKGKEISLHGRTVMLVRTPAAGFYCEP